MDKVLTQYIAQQSAIPDPIAAGAEQQSEPLAGFMPLVMMVGIFALMWFLMIRPQRKEEKRKKELLSSLKKGDSVVTTSGMMGSIATVKDDTVILKVGDGTKLEFLRSAVATVRNQESKPKPKEEK